MADIYATISEAEPQVQERLADVIELRAAEPGYQAMVYAYLAEIRFPPEAKVLEIGCGTGAVTRILAQWPGVAQAIGVDPSPVFTARARTLARHIANIRFDEGDGRCLQYADAMFDVVVTNTTLSHVPEPEQLLAEAYRVLRPGGWVAAFDGDYATATVASGANDPLEMCMQAFRENFVHDAWIVRRLPQLIRAAGFKTMPIRSYGYVEAPESGYLRSWVDRGADALVKAGRISQETADTLKAEAKRRSAARLWFGHVAFASILGQKPL